MSGIERSIDALLITGVAELYILSISVFPTLSISRDTVHCVFSDVIPVARDHCPARADSQRPQDPKLNPESRPGSPDMNNFILLTSL